MAVTPTRQTGQRSAVGGDFANYLLRIVPEFINPKWQEAAYWRAFVQSQPIAVICRETLIANLLALDWTIVARDSNQQDELRPKILEYTKLFENADAYYSDLDYTGEIEWIVKDLLDLPFGGCAELGRKGDDPAEDVAWVRPMDAGTLIPTLNYDYPVYQRVPDTTFPGVPFPRYAVSRVYLSPRTEIRREGWGMAPPEKIYLAMAMLARGDKYYAELLLNVPEAGILDLMDMEKDSALEWVNGWADLGNGTNPFKIPVLYEHNTPANFISFGKLPNDLMFDRNIMRYASIVCAGYGMTLSDIGLSTSSGNGGETLAGTIRSERKTKRTGFALLKKKLIAYKNRMLPPALEFRLIDYDDELQVALGRARLANAQAQEILIRNQVFSPDEARLQTMQDGLVTITIPEKLDRKSVEWPASGNSLQKNLLGNPKAPSSGGQGEVLGQQVIRRSETEFPELQDGLLGIFDAVAEREADDTFTEDVFLGTDLALASARTGLVEKLSQTKLFDADIQKITENIKKELAEREFRDNIETRLGEVVDKATLDEMLRGYQTPPPPQPNLTINVTIPEIKSSDVSVALPATTVNNIVDPTPVTIMNNVEPTPVQVTNENTVNVEPTPVQVTNQVETPKVTVKNTVDVPTPDVTVNLTQGNLTTVVHRDAQGRITEMETKEVGE